jgi:2-polyprenyl-3-methyl-5-hydroxy-6-metoxy-1,4-benzoquinol methylase
MLAPDMAEDLRQRRRSAYETARPDIQALVPPTARSVLDVGCASGALGEALKAHGAERVVGIELDPELAADARGRLDDVVEGDVAAVLSEPGGLGSFDCVIAADVLEHLADPWAALRHAVSLLEPGGSAVVSLPNVRNHEMFWSVAVRGRWPRREHGVFDRTHLNWFTLADARELLEGAGLEVTRTEPRYPFTGWRLSVANALARVGLGQFLASQYLLVGRRP